MATLHGDISLIKLLEAVFRLYVEWEGRDEDELRIRAAQIALEHDTLNREQIEILQRVASGAKKGLAAGGREYIVDAEKADSIIADNGPESSNDSFECLARADIKKSREMDPIEPQVWNYVVCGWLRDNWIDPTPSDEFGSQFEGLIRNYCARLRSWDRIRERSDGSGSFDVGLWAGSRSDPDVVSRRIAVLEESGLGADLFAEIEERYPEIVPRLQEKLGRIGTVEPTGSPKDLHDDRADASSKADTSRSSFAELTPDQADRTKPVGGHVDGTAGSAPGASETPHVPSRRHKAKWMAEAMLCVHDHPERSDRKIAKEVGIDPAQLSRCKEYQVAAKMARGDREPRKGFVTSDPASGLTDVDAVIEDPDPDF